MLQTSYYNELGGLVLKQNDLIHLLLVCHNKMPVIRNSHKTDWAGILPR